MRSTPVPSLVEEGLQNASLPTSLRLRASESGQVLVCLELLCDSLLLFSGQGGGDLALVDFDFFGGFGDHG